MKARGAQKIAAALLALEKDTAARLLQSLPDGPLEEISDAMVQLSESDEFDPEEAAGALQEFWQRLSTRRPTTEFQSLLQQALGDRAQPHLERLSETRDQGSPFAPLERLPAREVAEALDEEGPQAAALALASVRAPFAARVLEHVRVERRPELLRRIAQTELPPREILERVAASLLHRMGPVAPRPAPRAGATDRAGIDRAASILNFLNEDTEAAVGQDMLDVDEDLYTAIDQRRVTLDDIASLDKKSMHRVLASIDTGVLTMALKDVPKSVENAILNNISKRARATILEERDLLGTVARADVELAQRQMVMQVRSLIRTGEVVLHREGGDRYVD